MTWNWAALIAALLAGGTALYIRLRWRRAPQAFTAKVAVALCYSVAVSRSGHACVVRALLTTASGHEARRQRCCASGMAKLPYRQ
jgi:hypothetical protein